MCRAGPEIPGAGGAAHPSWYPNEDLEPEAMVDEDIAKMVDLALTVRRGRKSTTLEEKQGAEKSEEVSILSILLLLLFLLLLIT